MTDRNGNDQASIVARYEAAKKEAIELGFDLEVMRRGRYAFLLSEKNLYEIRGTAQLGLGRLDDATASLDRAFSLAAARHDDAAIDRVTRAAAYPHFWRGRSAEAGDVVARALPRLSNQAHRERASLQAVYAVYQTDLSRLEVAAEAMRQAKDTAERAGDAGVLGRVLSSEAYCLWWGRGEVLAAADAGQRALQLLPPVAVWDRADAMTGLSQAVLYTGSWATADTLRSEFDAMARRAGYQGAMFACEFVEHHLRWLRTGHTQAFLAEA